MKLSYVASSGSSGLLADLTCGCKECNDLSHHPLLFQAIMRELDQKVKPLGLELLWHADGAGSSFIYYTTEPAPTPNSCLFSQENLPIPHHAVCCLPSMSCLLCVKCCSFTQV